MSLVQALVLGSGFRGLAAAFVLAGQGHEVTVLDRAAQPGGVLAGLDWDGMALDLGCHLFDNTDANATRFFFDMAGGREAFVPVDVAYGNVTSGHLTRGLAVPDLSPEEAAAGEQLIGLLRALDARETVQPENLTEAVEMRFGVPLAREIMPLVAKVYAADPEALGAATLATSLFRRIRFLPDGVARQLKQLPELDARLAVAAARLEQTLYPAADPTLPRNFYPASGGMRGFVQRSLVRLKEMGVRFCMNAGELRMDGDVLRVQSEVMPPPDRIVCTLSPPEAERCFLGTERLKALVRGTPMVLYFFRTAQDNIADLHYCHLFDPALTAFRISSTGRYSGAYSTDGQSYVCAECPTEVGGPLWRDPEAHAARIWEEARLSGVAGPGGYSALKVVKTPVSYSAVLPGYGAAKQAVDSEISGLELPLVDLSSLSFTKLDIVSEVQQALS